MDGEPNLFDAVGVDPTADREQLLRAARAAFEHGPVTGLRTGAIVQALLTPELRAWYETKLGLRGLQDAAPRANGGAESPEQQPTADTTSRGAKRSAFFHRFKRRRTKTGTTPETSERERPMQPTRAHTSPRGVEEVLAVRDGCGPRGDGHRPGLWNPGDATAGLDPRWVDLLDRRTQLSAEGRETDTVLEELDDPILAELIAANPGWLRPGPWRSTTHGDSLESPWSATASLRRAATAWGGEDRGADDIDLVAATVAGEAWLIAAILNDWQAVACRGLSAANVLATIAARALGHAAINDVRARPDQGLDDALRQELTWYLPAMWEWSVDMLGDPLTAATAWGRARADLHADGEISFYAWAGNTLITHSRAAGRRHADQLYTHRRG